MGTAGAEPDSQTPEDIVRKHVFFRPAQGCDDWKSLPEFPTPEEILARHSNITELPENPVDIPWASKDEYLDAQYKILRHEAVEGLRRSVRSFADACRARKKMMDDDDTCIYTRVRVREYLMSTIGPIARASFSTERSNCQIQWQQSKRLQPGTIVALSPNDDNFRKVCKIASIAQRRYRGGLDQDPPLVDLLWADPRDAVLDPDQEMVMIESRNGYFEAARHALVGLQHAAQTHSPLDKYLVGAHIEDTPPKFLWDDPFVDLSLLAHNADRTDLETTQSLKSRNIVTGGMSDLEQLSWLDESQLRGVHRIISNELAIVQGPPGTGKTFTSVEAIKVMCAYRRRRRGPPIVVAAQTNHALDQILRHCLNAGANVLRLGGRTKDERIKERTLFELRQRNPVPADRKCAFVDNQRRANIKKIQGLLEELFGDNLLDANALREAGIITDAQLESLHDDTMEAHSALEARGPFALWLGDSLIPAEIIRNRHPTRFEVSEAEARQNLPEFECDDDELENIADDEEDQYQIQGTLLKLNHVWSGKAPAGLSTSKLAVERALAQNDDLFGIQPELRGAVYQYLQSKLLQKRTPEFAALLAENVRLCRDRKLFKFIGNVQLAQQQRIDIVGCTTTGLSKYRGCLAAMKPISLLIEEAAETREANIVSALYPSVQNLILVGDHKQLAPSCDIRELGNAPYNLNVPLFQRMVNLNVPYVMLEQQRRMKPELRSILLPFYPDLVDHPTVQSVNSRPDVPGMGGRNCWLFDHTWPEEATSDFSKVNEREAEMVTHFFVYLVCNGTPPEKVTVLTFYKGQRKMLLHKLRRHPALVASTLNVCTVDSYQGEENDVILLSLVRSPRPGGRYAIGFLEDERRAVVAISRARRGFYIFGNIENAREAPQASGDLWTRVFRGFESLGRVNQAMGIPLVCQPHQREIWIKDVEDWADNSGGCDMKCGKVRPCGHPCIIKCHGLPHENLPCSGPCPRILPCGHGCAKLCGQPCTCFAQCKAPLDPNCFRQGETRQRRPLEQRMIEMGGEPSEMPIASTSRHSALGQQETAPPGLPASPWDPGAAPTFVTYGHSQASETQSTFGEPSTTLQPTDQATIRARFIRNIAEFDKQIRRERLSSGVTRIARTTVTDVYQPTIVEAGRRVKNGGKIEKQIQSPTSEGPAASDDLQAKNASSSLQQVSSDFENLLLTEEPTKTTTGEHSGKGSSSRRRRKPGSRQKGPAEPANVPSTHHAEADTTLLDEPFVLVDMHSSIEATGDSGASVSHQTAPPLLAQPLIPLPSAETAGSMQAEKSATQPDDDLGEDWLIEL